MHLATNAYIVTSTLQNIAVAKTVSNLFIDNETTPISIEEQKYLGTREGNIHYWTSKGVHGSINYNFSHVFTPYNNLLWFIH